jgi:alkanesulfonate monooxygenase SsuD/methylene tetrahydromethanopterin reductase-like flavin-dependent oxidoreductase (luciferase family)
VHGRSEPELALDLAKLQEGTAFVLGSRESHVANDTADVTSSTPGDRCAILRRVNQPRSRPGPIGFRISATGSAGLDWPLLDASWARAGEHDVFDAGWTSDHLSDASRERAGVAFESFTTLAALAHRVPGRWLGVAVASATFRHPALLAKAATVLDNATAGRFILGLGSGWHAGEHDAFGIPLPPLPERFDRLESTLRVITALFGPEAAPGHGVTLDDPAFPLRQATNEPPAVRPGGPAIWLGGQRPRGIRLAVEYAEGWPMPGNRPGDVAYFATKRDEIRRALETAGRDPDDFTFAAQVDCGASTDDRRRALEVARRFRAAGATHVMLGLPAAAAGPDGVDAMVREVAEPLAGG